MSGQKRIENVKEKIHDVLLEVKEVETWALLSSLDEYWKAPASHKVELHGCWPGGLAEHSYNVYEYMMAIGKGVFPKAPEEKLKKDCAKAAFLHDLGKAGDEDGIYYEPETRKWHRETLKKFYEISNNVVQMPHPARSVWICLKVQLKLTKAQFHAILYHDMAYSHNNWDINPYWPLTLLLHHADMWSFKKDKI